MNGSVSQTVDQRVREVTSRLTAIEADWDGLGAVAPDPAAVEHASEVAARLFALGFPPPNRVGALNSGEPVLEWDDGPAHFEIAVEDAGHLSWMWSAPDAKPRQGRGLTAEAIKELSGIAPPQVAQGMADDPDRSPEMVGRDVELKDEGVFAPARLRRDTNSVPAADAKETV